MKETIEDEMVGWHHRLIGCEFEPNLGDSKVQGSLVCCSPWGCKELDNTEQRNSNRADAKSLQSCPNLCDPIDRSPPGSSISGIL